MPVHTRFTSSGKVKGYYGKAAKAARASSRAAKKHDRDTFGQSSRLFKRKYTKSGKYAGRAFRKRMGHLAHMTL